MNRIEFLIELINKVNGCTFAEVGRYIMQNTSYVSNDENSLKFIRKIKNNIANDNVVHIDDMFINFAKAILSECSLKIVFIGSPENYSDFVAHREFMESVEVYHVNVSQVDAFHFLLKTESDANIIIICDRDSWDEAQKKLSEVPMYLFSPMKELIYLLDIQIERARMRTLHHCSLNRELQHYLKNDEYHQVIIGSSYPWAAFPGELLSHSSNISMHCADITFSKTVLMGLQTIKPMSSVVLLLGPYDLYYELSLSRNSDILSTFNALENFCYEHAFQYETTHNPMYAYIFKQYTWLTSKDFLPLFFIDSLFYKRDVGCEISKKTKFLTEGTHQLIDPPQMHQQAYIENDKKRKYSSECKDADEHKKSCLERAIKHSKHSNYKNSLQRNKKHIQDIICFAEENNFYVNIVMSPFPCEYVKYFNKDMISESRHFFSNLKSDRFRYIDLLEDSHFSHVDFYDGDHLNFSGAKKLKSRLKELSLHV